jgi:pyruvate kinase
VTRHEAAAWRRAKLVCTIGPTSIHLIDELIAAGMDVARINLSHGRPESHADTVARVRSAADAARRPVAILVDLAGPKIRLGDLAGAERTLTAGERLGLRTDGAAQRDTEVEVDHPALADELEPGDRVLLADGAAELRVVAMEGPIVWTEVVRPGTIRSRAGVSVPSERFRGSGLTDRDRADVARILDLGVDIVAQSFVRRASDVEELRGLLGPDGPPIVAKIETRPATEAFDEISGVADAVMIARGDLGVELPYELVPILQKRLVRRALDRGVPSIVATQMLESMVSSPRPTRAEASDVANAVFDGADAIMLSAETAIGAHPVLAAEAAVRIAELCEREGASHFAPGAAAHVDSDAGALAVAAATIASSERGVAAVACYTRTGRTARVIASLRPPVPILAYSPDPAVVRRLSLVHGVHPRSCVPPADFADRLDLMAWLVAEDGSLPPGASVVLVASTSTPGTGPNLLELHRIPDAPSAAGAETD